MPRIPAIGLILVLQLAAAAFCGLESKASDKVASASTLDSASDLAKQLAAAYGGMAKIKEMLNRGSRSHGSINSFAGLSSASNSFECEFLSKGNKLRIQMQLLGQDKIEVYDGKSGWTSVGGWVSRANKKTAERIAEELKHGLNALANLDDPGFRLETLPDKQVNGKLCQVLKLSSPDGNWTLLYLDKVSKMVLRSEFMGFDSEQGVSALKATNYYDYRPIMGFPTPFRLIEFVADKKTQEAQLDAVSIDDDITDELFQMPEESRYSRLSSGPITLPFEFSGGEILVSARVNNQQEAKFILDTGASQTVIDKSLAQSLGPTTIRTFSVTAGNRAMPLSYATLNKLQLGDLSIDNVATLITDLSSLGATIGQKPAGLIGANVLKRFLLTIDFQDKKITLSDPLNVSVPDKAIVVPSSPVFASTALVVRGNLDGEELNFLVDTGASFNNLPYGLARKFQKDAVPVGQLEGLDGNKTTIGAIKFKSLQLEEFVLKNPVFAIQPERANGGGSGLFSAKDIGILGNPVWSKCKLTIDYRNDRLLVEPKVDSQTFDSYLQELDEVQQGYLRKQNIDQAASAYEKIMNKAKAAGQNDIQALALARLSGLYADRFQSTKESHWLDIAAREYERAAKLAVESRNRNVEGQILAQWAMLYLNAPRSSTDLSSAQTLLSKAMSRCSNDASICASLGSAMLKTGKSPLGVKFIDTALLIDPANWQALWEKVKILGSEKKAAELKLVAAQLARYYPDFPQVKELQAKLARAASQAHNKASPANPQSRSAGKSKK